MPCGKSLLQCFGFLNQLIRMLINVKPTGGGGSERERVGGEAAGWEGRKTGGELQGRLADSLAQCHPFSGNATVSCASSSGRRSGGPVRGPDGTEEQREQAGSRGPRCQEHRRAPGFSPQARHQPDPQQQPCQRSTSTAVKRHHSRQRPPALRHDATPTPRLASTAAQRAEQEAAPEPERPWSPPLTLPCQGQLGSRRHRRHSHGLPPPSCRLVCHSSLEQRERDLQPRQGRWPATSREGHPQRTPQSRQAWLGPTGSSEERHRGCSQPARRRLPTRLCRAQLAREGASPEDSPGQCHAFGQPASTPRNGYVRRAAACAPTRGYGWHPACAHLHMRVEMQEPAQCTRGGQSRGARLPRQAPGWWLQPSGEPFAGERERPCGGGHSASPASLAGRACWQVLLRTPSQLARQGGQAPGPHTLPLGLPASLRSLGGCVS